MNVTGKIMTKEEIEAANADFLERCGKLLEDLQENPDKMKIEDFDELLHRLTGIKL